MWTLSDLLVITNEQCLLNYHIVTFDRASYITDQVGLLYNDTFSIMDGIAEREFNR